MVLTEQNMLSDFMEWYRFVELNVEGYSIEDLIKQYIKQMLWTN